MKIRCLFSFLLSFSRCSFVVTISVTDLTSPGKHRGLGSAELSCPFFNPFEKKEIFLGNPNRSKGLGAWHKECNGKSVVSVLNLKLANDRKGLRQRIKGMNRVKNKGFSLIELLIVVAIILIIAAIAIPNLLRARMAADDSSAAASEHTIIVGEVGYYGAYPTIGYATLAQLGTGLIEQPLALASAAPGKSGYIFTAVANNAALPYTFYTTATPISNQTGTKSFCAADDGVVRTNASGVLTVAASYAGCLGFTPMSN